MIQSTMTVTRKGTQAPSQGPAEYFTGSVRVEHLFPVHGPESRVSAANVTFQPGARSAWHTHPLGQNLIVTAGRGWVQQEGGEKYEIRPGDVVWTPPGVKHWHGATPNERLTHIAIQEWLDGKNVQWMEKVTDQEYLGGKVAASAQATPAATRSSDNDVAAVAPGLERYRQDVLVDDLWKRPGLTPRDRSIVTVAASEVLAHLAFYAGWPNVFAAVPVAREVFEKRPR